MENNMNNAEKVLFESKGMPTKMRNVLFICGVSLLIIGIVGLAITLIQPNYTGYQSSGPKMMDGSAVIAITAPSGIRTEERSRNIKVFTVALVVGALSFSVFNGGRKFYFRIYERHIEGSSGFGFLLKKINIPIEQIGELTANEEGWMPSILIRTVHGNNVPIFMNRDKVIDAESILRHMLNSQM